MSISHLSSVGELLRHFRVSAALSQDELAERSGISSRAISDLERGQRTGARLETIRLLAEGLNLDAGHRALLIRASQPAVIEITLGPPIGPFAQVGPPSFLTRYIGRAAEGHQLRQCLLTGEYRIITITGPGGVGKTRLAAEVVSSVASEFADGLVWVDLSPCVDADSVISAIHQAIISERETRDAGIDALCDQLADRQMVLVLDTFEHVMTCAPLVARVATRAPNLKIVITSRTRLRVSGERELMVSALPVPSFGEIAEELEQSPAVVLMLDRFRNASPQFDAESYDLEIVTNICRALDGIPLAIELVAAHARALSPAELVSRLDSPLNLLTQGNRDLPLRQQTLRATIGWSYDLLGDQSKQLLQMLAVFPGGFAIDTCEALAGDRGADPAQALSTLEELIDFNLVYRASAIGDSHRYAMLDSIRAFATEMLDLSGGRETAEASLIRYCRRLSTEGRGFPFCIVSTSWVRSVDLERSNIRSAYQILLHGPDDDALLDFVTAFGHYLYNRGPLSEASQWFQSAMSRSGSEPPYVRLQLLYWSSHLSGHDGDLEISHAYALEAVKLAKELSDIEWLAATIHCLALVTESLGDLDKAERLAKEHMRLWKQAGILGLTAFGHSMLGAIALRRGDHESARGHRTQAMELFFEMGGYGFAADAMCILGEIALEVGDFQEAAQRLQESVELASETRVIVVMYRPLLGLAILANKLGEHLVAAQLMAAAENGLAQNGQRFPPRLMPEIEHVRADLELAIDGAALDSAREEAISQDFDDWIALAEIATSALADPMIVQPGSSITRIP